MALISYNTNNIIFTGTYGNLVFYYWRGKYCCRTKSTLSGKRVKTTAAFRLTMQYAMKLGCASKIAAHVYRQLPPGWKLHSLYRKMTGLGFQLLKEQEQSAEAIETALWQYLASAGFKAEQHPVSGQTCRVSVKLPPARPHKIYFRYASIALLFIAAIVQNNTKAQRKKYRKKYKITSAANMITIIEHSG